VVACDMVLPIEFPRPISDEEIEELSRRNPTLCFERTSEGELVVSPPAGAQTGVRTSELNGQLRDWNRRAGGGTLFDSQVGFKLPDGALLSPDAAWLSHGRFEALDAATREKFCPLCPDLVFEILSPSDYFGATRRKIATFVKNGTLCAVLLDPFGRKVEVHERGGIVRVLNEPASLTISVTLLPSSREDLHLDLQQILAN